MSKQGSQEYYNSQFKLFAEWELDFVKADDIVNIPELEGISKALRSCGRKMGILYTYINIKVQWSRLGLTGNEYKVRDICAKKDLGSFKNEFSAPINTHGAGLYKISK